MSRGNGCAIIEVPFFEGTPKVFQEGNFKAHKRRVLEGKHDGMDQRDTPKEENQRGFHRIMSAWYRRGFT